MDIAPTLLDVAGVAPSGEDDQGDRVSPLMGNSVLPFLAGETDTVREDDDYVGWEQFSRAIRQGRWKATWISSPFGPDDWQLFDVVTDISERNDLADANTEKLNELILLWEEYAEEVGVVLPQTTLTLGD
jgi:arylsulfatase